MNPDNNSLSRSLSHGHAAHRNHHNTTKQPNTTRRAQAMGAFGSAALLAAVKAAGRGTAGGRVRVLTHCNTGSLATAGYGTALGVIRALSEQVGVWAGGGKGEGLHS